MDQRISFHSPRFAGTLRRAAPVVDKDLCARAFEATMLYLGRPELDFDREDGVSYNPRPARIGLILLDNADISDSLTLAAAMLASLPDAETIQLARYSARLPETVAEISLASKRPIDRLAEEIPETIVAIEIALAHWLDRARHIHLTSGGLCDDLYDTFYSDTLRHITAAEKIDSKLTPLLTAWINRFARNQRKVSNS